MAVTNKYYGKFFLALANKEVDLNSDSIKVALVTSTYTFDQDLHAYWSDITNEVVGTGYTAGGAVVATPSIAYDGASNTFAFDGADVSWTGSTITARGAVVYDDTPATAATKPLICFIDFGADVVTSSGTFQLTFDSSGIATITVS